ncbi:hypothetical protein HF086_005007 [Spodoptera exigua]|uniref:Uncharacterized protein n=1 Tax=Spodoptera exigua TaxID=7107 RepID=A0A922S8W6_SPOEX|nr:hypothetical protein HF086_005007 [Spodoptera exigua]
MVVATEVYPEKLETTLGNNKYFKNLKFTFRKSSRNSPYYINFDFYSTCGYGNNVSVKWVLFEYISGRYVQVPVQFEYKLCDFFYKDPFLGQMYAKQLPPNWTCPFPAGRSPFRKLILHLENLPRIPFTYESLIVRTRVNLVLWIGNPAELIATIKVYTTVKQTMKKIDMRAWDGTILANHTFA